MAETKPHLLFCVIGRTGSGKTSLSKKVTEDMNLKMVKSFTTRKPRKEELNNKSTDHIFITSSEALWMLKNENIMAYTEINNNTYFSTENQLLESDIYIIDPNGFRYLKSKIKPEKIKLIPVYIDAFETVRKRRYIDRDEFVTEEDFYERNNSEKIQFDIFLDDFCEKYTYELGLKECRCKIDNNQDFEDAVSDLELFILEMRTKFGDK